MGILFVALIILKIMGYVTMSWFWVVTSIVWIPLGILAMWFLVLGSIAGVAVLAGLAMEKFSK